MNTLEHLAKLRAIVDQTYRSQCPMGCIEVVMCDQCSSYRDTKARAQLEHGLFDIAPELIAVAEALAERNICICGAERNFEGLWDHSSQCPMRALEDKVDKTIQTLSM